MRMAVLCTSVLLVVLSAFSVAELRAGELNAGVDVGDWIPSYASTKCGGVDDGVAVGKVTCYTCRSGNEPVFYVFVKQPSEKVIGLLKEIDALVAAKRKDKVVGVVNFLGDPEDQKSRDKAAFVGKKHGLEHVALTVTADGDKFDIDNSADVTVMMFEKGVIRLKTSANSDQLDADGVKLVMRRAKSLIE